MKIKYFFWWLSSNNNGNFFCLNCLHSIRTENKLQQHENACKDYEYFYIEMPKKDNKVSEYNHGKKSMKVLFIVYADWWW